MALIISDFFNRNCIIAHRKWLDYMILGKSGIRRALTNIFKKKYPGPQFVNQCEKLFILSHLSQSIDVPKSGCRKFH